MASEIYNRMKGKIERIKKFVSFFVFKIPKLKGYWDYSGQKETNFTNSM